MGMLRPAPNTQFLPSLHYRLASEDDQEEVHIEAEENGWPDADSSMMVS